MTEQWIMVDDTDPGIVYSGPWVADVGTLDSDGTLGPPYLSTVHGTTSQASFSYTFSGSSFTLTGAVQVPRLPNAGNTTWQCILDGTSITVNDPAQVDNRVEFCGLGALTDGPHTLVVNAVGTSQQTFWFDLLQYIPLANASLANAAVYSNASDPLVLYGGEWSTHYPGFLTNQAGATVQFSFTGVSVIWYGFYDSTYPSAATTATYTVDGANPQTIPLNGAIADPVQWSQPFFTTDAFSAGEHTFRIVYNGNAASTPLSVQTLIVNGGTLATLVTVTSSPSPSLTSSSLPSSSQGSSLSSGSPSPASTSPAPAELAGAHRSKSHVGQIVGGAVAGLLFLLLLVAVPLFLRKRRRVRERTQQEFEPVLDLGDSNLNSPNDIFSQFIYPYGDPAQSQSQSPTSRPQYTTDLYPSYFPPKTASQTQFLSVNANRTSSDIEYRTPQTSVTSPPRYAP